LKTDSAPPFALEEDDAHPPYNTTAAFNLFFNSVTANITKYQNQLLSGTAPKFIFD
jgi:hypothetical protein